MFKFLRRKPKTEQSLAEYPGSDTVAQMIFLQLPLCGLDPVSLCSRLATDPYGLGYVFGLADMANYQFNREQANDQGAALNYIRNVFILALGGGGEERFVQALQMQRDPEFHAGRECGADDLGTWLKSKGQSFALGLSTHFSD